MTKFEDAVRLALRMRDAQKKYFALRRRKLGQTPEAQAALKSSLELEAEFDRLMKNLGDP